MTNEELNEAFEQEYQAGFHDGYEEGTKNYSRTVETLKDLINRMSEKTTQLTAERDAAVADLRRIADCGLCSHFNPALPYVICLRCERGSEFEWRGLSLESKTSDKGGERMSIESKIMDLINEYGKKHERAKTCGSEYIYQSDSAHIDAINLVAEIFDLYAAEEEKHEMDKR